MPRVPRNRGPLYSRRQHSYWWIPVLFIGRFPAVRFEPKTAGYDAQMLPLCYALAHFIRVVLLNVSQTNFPKVLLEAGTSLSFFNFFGQNLFRSLISRMFSFFQKISF